MGHDDTIFALSSGAPPAAIAVVRISGPAATEALNDLIGMDIPARSPRVVTVKGTQGNIIDRPLALRFAGPASATGEDVVELHLHGGRAVVDAVLARLGELDGLRQAEPGEFTRRAFENGRLDLLEAEGLADLLAAETETQRRQAMGFASGGVSQAVAAWQDECLTIAARIEAAIDFSDEDDVGDADVAAIHMACAALAAKLAAWLDRPPAERLRDGITVAIAGPPNAGKSTLLNAIAQREAAITAPTAGTTRDIVEVPVAIGGIAYRFADTAGLRDDSDDAVEAIGIARALAAAAEADILVWLGSDDPPTHSATIRIAAQADRRSGVEWDMAVDAADVVVSALTGEGMAALLDAIAGRARDLLPREGDVALNRRQRDTLADVAAALDDAQCARDLLIVAEHLRSAMSAFDRLTGRARTEDMLDALFGRFCIGK
ncbi:tRNA uridine-5-carboxymethylaminomethyl(34) synthesis GTPase MnmE [Sphingorhabdus soli]|uniref:tRNA modification GTPase MnmE n=1 Tax=Flavisphingopyxis soli TaxID=2601267 RepID=A0A5C6ULM5_9SPHN|nr:tRNA uridine-5-carboxymethylaminomethyl(34) synthesis GTPase MnmE [Sphingorhabdus soli]TXC73404.1 tRNA uridine-5-carboxymethylaminomethyl(34) synthesis GTPase MnmE [Sphingorhabdus soli]